MEVNRELEKTDDLQPEEGEKLQNERERSNLDQNGALASTSSEQEDHFDLKELEEALPKPNQVLDDLTLSGVAQYIKSGKGKNVIFLTGAGISTSSGIPDFRSPGSGLYHNLQKYNLPHPQKNPKPFFALAKELYPGKFKPTCSHYLMKLFHNKGILLRTFTQNIDTLEHIAGIPSEKIVEAHGTFRIGHCTKKKCKREYTQEWMRERIFCDEIPMCTVCKSVVKPDIVFFGEQLPDRFFTHIQKDFDECDLLIVMGTSLLVHPFASLVDRVPAHVPRLLINDEKVGQRDFLERLLGNPGLDFDSEDNYRDVFAMGYCDDRCQEFAELLGWKAELESLLKSTSHDDSPESESSSHI